MKKVFLGGTCNGSTWRNEMEALLDLAGLDYFNPVVDNWDERAQAIELIERENCAFCLYTITPQMLGTYSIAEVVDDSNKRPNKTVFVLLENSGNEEFNASELKSLQAVVALVKRNGGKTFTGLYEAAFYMRDN